MTKHRIVWERYFSVEVPADWQFEEDNGVISLFDPEGVGAVQVSFARGPEDAEINLDEWSTSFADALGLGDTELIETTVGGALARRFEALSQDDEPMLWRVWHCDLKGRVATVSYVCAIGDSDMERLVVDRLIQSIQWCIGSP